MAQSIQNGRGGARVLGFPLEGFGFFTSLLLSFAAGPERFSELVEIEGVFPAPYFARAHWVAVERWNTLPAAELKQLLRAARGLVYEKLPAKTTAVLAMSPAEKKRLIAGRKKVAAAKGKKG